MQQLAATLALRLGHHIEIHLKHARVGTLGIGKYMQLAHIQGLDKRQVIVPTPLGLTSYTHHTIHTNKRMRHHAANMLYPLGKELTCITSLHNLKYLITTRLQWDMEVRREVARLGNKLDYLIRQQIGFAGGDTYAVVMCRM